jgi:hypothetical protein
MTLYDGQRKREVKQWKRVTVTYFSQAFGEESTRRSMTISPKEVSRSTLMSFESRPKSHRGYN